MRNRLSEMFVLTAGILWGCMGILVRTMNEGGFTSFEVAAFRAIVTGVLMVVGMGIGNREALKVKWKDLWCFAGTGILSVTFFNVCYFSCMNYTTLSTAAILLYTAPTFVMIMSFFLFKESMTARKGLAVVLAFVGCVLVSGGFGGLSISTMGLLTGLGAGFGYALYSIFSRYALQRGYNSLTITTYTFVFSAIGILPFVNWNHALACTKQVGIGMLFSAFMVIVVTVLPYIFYTKGLQGMENGKASILASVEPVMASLVGFLLYKEAMTPVAIVGMLLVLGSCVVMGQKKVKK